MNIVREPISQHCRAPCATAATARDRWERSIWAKARYPEEERYGLDNLAVLHGGSGYFNRSYYENESGPTILEGRAPEVETNLAIRFMERHLDSRPEDPFALFVSWRPPHWPYKQYPAAHSMYDPADVDVPGNVPEQMVDFASKEIADYYGCCTGLDEQMARLMEALDRLGVNDNTIACYTSDHGDHLSSHGYGKPNDYWLHESDARLQSHAVRRVDSCTVCPALARNDACWHAQRRFYGRH